MTKDLATILGRVAGLVESGWCQHRMAADIMGFMTQPEDDAACYWCLTGAVERAHKVPLYAEADDTIETRFSLYAAIADAIGEVDMSIDQQQPAFLVCQTWNDTIGRTQAEVVSVVKRAIENAQAIPTEEGTP